MSSWTWKIALVTLGFLSILDYQVHAQARLFRRWPFVRFSTRTSNNFMQRKRQTTDQVSFHLYPDPRNANYHERLLIGDVEVLKRSGFNPKLPIIFCIHGFLNNYTTDFSQTMKDAYLTENFSANIIAVDWGPLATPPGAPNLNYHVVVERLPIVGNAVAQFIRFLIQTPNHGISGPDKVHIIGFSLGAHISGIAGYELLQSGFAPIARITGLDPAGPLFQMKERESKLDSTDANFVDIVHTNQGMKGYSGLMGHVDFFPNGGGPFQPGCRNGTDVFDFFTGSCSHAQAYRFFAKSIKNKNIMACKCMRENPTASRTFIDPQCLKDCQKPIVFGQHCPKSARGVYYMPMNV